MSRILSLLSLSLACSTASAATLTVTRFDDPSPNGCLAADCSLREAVLTANATSGSDTIVLGSGTYALRQPGLATPMTVAVTSGITFTGAGRDLTRVEGRGRGSLFSVAGVKVSFAGMTMAKGNANWASTSPSGGAIRVVSGVVRLTGVRIADNRAIAGGGLHATASTLELIDTLVEGNESEGDGGGVFAQATTLRLRSNTSVRDNVAAWGGGGIAVHGELLGDDDCDISGNTAKRGGGVLGLHQGALVLHGVATAGGDGLFDIAGNLADNFEPMFQVPTGNGGGLHTFQDLDLQHVAITDNQSNAWAGGIVVSGGTLVLRDSYIANNFAAQAGGGARISSTQPMLIERVGIDGNVAVLYGGGMQLGGGTGASPSTATLRNVDFHGNTAQQHGALYNNNTALTISHTSFWNNTDNEGAAAIVQGSQGSTTYFNSLLLGRCVGPATLGQGLNMRSLETDDQCDGVGDPALLALSRDTFGGRFPITGTTSPTSSLIDLGRLNLCIGDDIRGFAREAACDVGAFEYEALQ